MQSAVFGRRKANERDPMALQYRGVRTSFLFVNFDKVAALKAARSRVNAVRYSTMWFHHVMIPYSTVQYSIAE